MRQAQWRIEVFAPLSQMDAGKYDFLVSRTDQFLHLVVDEVRGQAAAPPANVRHHAVRAKGIAPVLYFQHSPGSARVHTRYRKDFKFRAGTGRQIECSAWPFKTTG